MIETQLRQGDAWRAGIAQCMYEHIETCDFKLSASIGKIGKLLDKISKEASNAEQLTGLQTVLEAEHLTYANARVLRDELEHMIASFTVSYPDGPEASMVKTHCPQEINQHRQNLMKTLQPLVEALRDRLYGLSERIATLDRGIEKCHEAFSRLDNAGSPLPPIPGWIYLPKPDPVSNTPCVKDPLVSALHERYSNVVSEEHSTLKKTLESQFTEVHKFFGDVYAQIELAQNPLDPTLPRILSEQAKEALEKYKGFVQTVFAASLLEQEFCQALAYFKRTPRTWLDSSEMQTRCHKLLPQINSVDQVAQQKLETLEKARAELQKSKEALFSVLNDTSHVRAMTQLLTRASQYTPLNSVELALIYTQSLVCGVQPTFPPPSRVFDLRGTLSWLFGSKKTNTT